MCPSRPVGNAGVTVDEIVVGDPPEAWVGAGFAVDDGVARIGHVRVRLVGRDRGEHVLGWSLRNAGDGPVDGLPTSGSDAPLPEPAEHPNGAQLVDHVVIATPDCDRTVAAFADRGLRPRRERRAEGRGAVMRQVFLRAGEVILEVVGPVEPTGGGGARFFGLALTVADLAAAGARLGDAIGEPKDAVQPGRRIATVRHRDLGISVPLALMSPEPGRP